MTMDIGSVHGRGPDHFGLVTSDGEGAATFARHISAIGNLSGHIGLLCCFGLVRDLRGVFSGGETYLDDPRSRPLVSL